MKNSLAANHSKPGFWLLLLYLIPDYLKATPGSKSQNGIETGFEPSISIERYINVGGIVDALPQNSTSKDFIRPQDEGNN